MNRNKYGAKKIKTDEGVFDSRMEYRRYIALKSDEAAGKISDLRRQVPFELIPNQRINGKVKERAVKYIADFVYMQDGQQIVEDVKGKLTKEYILKRKLMLFIHGIAIKETRLK